MPAAMQIIREVLRGLKDRIDDPAEVAATIQVIDNCETREQMDRLAHRIARSGFSQRDCEVLRNIYRERYASIGGDA